MSDLVGNPEDRFSQNEAHFTVDFERIIVLIFASSEGGNFDRLRYATFDFMKKY